ncbi:MAG TPA: hypothetical protein PLA65_12975 [Spirochaetota bacterium]|nr:hypothetical protein [Spirochaetota bacterium]HOD13699.1 hypothetical protein [Spirochaetota bacterium]HPG51218.1 hypothetical protein [Spirochaetota bacterium]HPN12970.1 hypothetical protein [Spirochaetota bacterium]
METRTKIFGMPVLSVGAFANGFIAIGWMGRGVITIAQFGYGLIAVTQFGFGVVSVSQFGVGIVAIAQGALGLFLAIGQGALGFISAGLSARGYYCISGPGVWKNVPLVLAQTAANPLPFIIWAAGWALLFMFLWSQRDKLTFKMSLRDLFRSRKKHRDDRIRARAVSALTNQVELLNIVMNDPSEVVKKAALKNITDPDKLVKIAKTVMSEDCAAVAIAALASTDTATLASIAGEAALPGARICAITRLSRADRTLLVRLACSEQDQAVLQSLVELIGDAPSLQQILREASSARAKIIALGALAEPDQAFLFDIVRNEKDLTVCEAAAYRITDTAILARIIRGDYHTAVRTAAIEQVEDKELLTKLAGEELPEPLNKAIAHRLGDLLPVYQALTIELTCPYCSQPVFVNGPLKKAHCQSCQRETAVTGPVWAAIRDAGYGVSSFTSPLRLVLEKRGGQPACSACGGHLPTNDLPKGKRATVQCPSCMKEHSSFPVPGWLAWSRNAELVLCAEEEGVRSPAEKEAKPVAISCIKCGAPLEITMETPRNATCKYCTTVQFLPDPLWLSLHPVKIKQAWYIRSSYKDRK